MPTSITATGNAREAGPPDPSCKAFALGGLESGVLQPLVDALTAELLKHDVLHADETPVAILKPGNGKTHRAYL